MRKFIFFILIITLITSGFSSIKAFLIYEALYDDQSILPLPLAEKDANNLKEALSKIPDSQITLLRNPTTGEFVREFRKWINSTSPQDTLIVYYAGHGISKDGEFYFIPSDADIEDSFTW
ncbi:MAG: caspase family protein, partial [Thermotogaceae bacterium]|nr:caspase family protein [Thermotogaceae bacterium]